MNGKHHSLLRAIVLSTVLAPTVGATADGRDISFNAGVDFRTLKTFVIRTGQITSDKPEIDNRLFRQRMEESIRATLVKKGLLETADQPDVTVTYSVRDRDARAVERQGPTRVQGGVGNPGFVLPPAGPRPVLYTEGTLVIDFNNASGSLLWRGTWRDQEASSPTLARKLSDDARKLLQDFPPKRR